MTRCSRLPRAPRDKTAPGSPVRPSAKPSVNGCSVGPTRSLPLPFPSSPTPRPRHNPKMRPRDMNIVVANPIIADIAQELATQAGRLYPVVEKVGREHFNIAQPDHAADLCKALIHRHPGMLVDT